MANYHFNTSYGDCFKAPAHAQYILAQGKYEYKKDEVLFSESKLPSWSDIPKEFWDSSFKYERANARAYREFRFSLPNELSKDENEKLVKEFIENTLQNRFYYSVAIHDKEAAFGNNNERNTHCHLMFCERELDGIDRTKDKFFKKYNHKKPAEGGAKKTREFKPKDRLIELRKEFEILVNSYYEKNDLEERVSCESLKKQKQMAEQEGDLDKAEFLDRTPITIESYIKMKPVERLTENEQNKLKYYELSKEYRDIKRDIYLEAIREAELEETKKELNLSEPIKIIELDSITKEDNLFDKYLSNEKDILTIDNEIKKHNEYIENLELRTLFALDKESYNVYRAKELLEKELHVLDHFSEKNDTYFIERQKIENKIFRSDEALEISINEYKENNSSIFNKKYVELKDKFSDEIETLKINKISLVNENENIAKNINKNDLEATDYERTSLNQNAKYNLESYLKTVKEYEKWNKAIDNINKKLEPETLEKTTLNKLTNGNYYKLENLKKFYTNEIKLCEFRIRQITNPTEIKKLETEKSCFEIKLKNINDEIKNEVSKLTKEDVQNLRNALTIQLKEKIPYFEDQRNLTKATLDIQKSNFILTNENSALLKDKIAANNNRIEKIEDELIKCQNSKNKTESFFSRDRIMDLAYLKTTKGETLKLRTEYTELNTVIKGKELELSKVSSFNIIQRSHLSKEINSLNENLSEIKSKYDSLHKNIDKKEFLEAYNSILDAKSKADNAIKSIETPLILEKIELQKDNRIMGSLVKELYPYQDLQDKQQNINFNKLMLHSAKGGGGAEHMEEDYFNLEKKSKNNDFER